MRGLHSRQRRGEGGRSGRIQSKTKPAETIQRRNKTGPSMFRRREKARPSENHDENAPDQTEKNTRYKSQRRKGKGRVRATRDHHPPGLRGAAWLCCAVLRCAERYCPEVRCPEVRCVLLCFAAPCFATARSPAPYFPEHSAMLCYTYFTALCCAVLWCCAVLSCSDMCCAQLRCAVLRCVELL